MSWPAKGRQLEQQEMRRLAASKSTFLPLSEGKNHLGSELCVCARAGIPSGAGSTSHGTWALHWELQAFSPWNSSAERTQTSKCQGLTTVQSRI